jgi:hypothetical protein
MQSPKKIQEALTIYHERQTRQAHPAGARDSAGRFFPGPGERQACCADIRSPSRAWPHTLSLHCRSIAHISALCGVDASAVRKAKKSSN